MYSASELAVVLLVAVGVGAAAAEYRLAQETPHTIVVPAAPEPRPPAERDSVLRVCADPNNMPFSNDRGEGFENALARLVAAELGRTLEYTWWPQRRGFVRNTLKAGSCDLVMGIPASYELAEATVPYYRSSYVFVTRRDRGLRLASLDDPRLRRLRIGIHTIGDDYANVPPAEALAARSIVSNVRGYSIYGDYSKPDPPRALVDAVAAGELDVAIAWGPLAGYFARHERVPLDVVPVTPALAGASLPMAFDISMGVRRGDAALKRQVESVLRRRKADITHLLASFGVPDLQPAGGAQ